MKRDKITIILIIFLLIGISLLLYPTLADFWNASRSTKIVNDYSKEVTNLSEKKRQDLLKEAWAYNEEVKKRQFATDMTKKEEDQYYSTLKLPSTDIMATVEVPSINVKLPIYHGTKESILQSALGHIEWSSLPVGGLGTHAVITGHRGLISARLFTDLEQLVEGDLFYLRVMGEKLSYQVDQIRIVLPHETQDLMIDPNKDYVTLLTCTPYGINTHRLLVRGHRVENKLAVLQFTSEASRVKPFYVSLVLMVPIGLATMSMVFYLDKRKRKEEKLRKEWMKNVK